MSLDPEDPADYRLFPGNRQQFFSGGRAMAVKTSTQGRRDAGIAKEFIKL
ncbi:hypothetical protein [Thiohalobacter sp. COW1]|nr:hypothetical protein [Thiohalobacter sp. COW1]